MVDTRGIEFFFSGHFPPALKRQARFSLFTTNHGGFASGIGVVELAGIAKGLQKVLCRKMGVFNRNSVQSFVDIHFRDLLRLRLQGQVYNNPFSL